LNRFGCDLKGNFDNQETSRKGFSFCEKNNPRGQWGSVQHQCDPSV